MNQTIYCGSKVYTTVCKFVRSQSHPTVNPRKLLRGRDQVKIAKINHMSKIL